MFCSQLKSINWYLLGTIQREICIRIWKEEAGEMIFHVLWVRSVEYTDQVMIGSVSPAATVVIYWIPPLSLAQTAPGSSVSHGTPGPTITFLLTHFTFITSNILSLDQFFILIWVYLVINFNLTGKIWKPKLGAGWVFCRPSTKKKVIGTQRRSESFSFWLAPPQ